MLQRGLEAALYKVGDTSECKKAKNIDEPNLISVHVPEVPEVSKTLRLENDWYCTQFMG